MKVIEKIKAASEEEKTIFSFEYFLPRTDNGVENLLDRIERMVTTGPSFCDITWRPGATNEQRTLDVADKMQNKVQIETMMHLTCIGMPVERIDHALDTIKSNGIQNVLALRGDPLPDHDQVPGEFTCALDLVNHIRAKYGDHVGITVAGYPETHPDMIQGDIEDYFKGEDYLKAYQNELAYLKRKVDAGADLVVTQLFYDTDNFLKFVNDCRQVGITCPIVPGIMPIFTYSRFASFTGRYKTKVPSEIKAALEPIKDNDEAVKAYGIHLATEMCKKILAHGIKELHFYTLNREEQTLAVLMNLGLIHEVNISKSIPSKSPTNGLLVKEEAKQILSSSHISKTQGSDQNQQEQHGNSINPSNGALTGNPENIISLMQPHSFEKKFQETLKSVEKINGVEKSVVQDPAKGTGLLLSW